MFSEKRNVLQLLSLLKAHNISRFVVSPGSRHIPIVISMECDPFFKLYSVVDERSASFFAIGLMQCIKEPVGIICTSGTASANYCSAINECLYQELPLLIITADREEALRDQHEDQMIRQSNMYVNIAKMVANLPLVNTERDAWFNNRLINEALLELNHHGCGPVQINIPVPDHQDSFASQTLPQERKISRFDLNSINWQNISQRLTNKKIVIVCGEGFVPTINQLNDLELFAKKYDAVILSDKMSNCHTANSIENAFAILQALSGKDLTEIAPDIIISIRANFSFNPELKGLVKNLCTKGFKIQNWFVHQSGRVVDPYQGLLTDIFEMDEFTFFRNVALQKNDGKEESDYCESWKVISESIEEPKFEFGHLKSVGEFLKRIPKNSVLHLANSNSVRMAQLYNVDSSVEIHCNRGTDGIDGCMSSAVGFASDSTKLNYLMIGDLTFFYDMNALWNPQLSKNLRILLDNNGGGAIMHMPQRPQFALDLLPNYISARHNASAEAWAKDRGFKYYSARNAEELQNGVDALTDVNVEGPILLEVFTNLFDDVKCLKEYYAQIDRNKLDKSLTTRSKRVVKKVCLILGIDPAKLKTAILG